ncbi:hypothetical protein SADUNF_Sadunf01G0016800 [Salix dunnii]|uniref:Uncharacterized protein n=1 Tax=Salix dunnii TaxID=1413687 RepID=A0A835TLL2_9ROSI|nr:hypothetical protein SADUNF_Sadunf01G0016800 [Salix dunnii]
MNDEHAQLWSQPGGRNSFDVEMTEIFQDPAVSPMERKEWIKKQMLQLLEQRVSIQAQAFELEKQRFKWLRYCSKKDKEFERLRLENERRKLENEHSALQLRQKQLEMDFRSSEPSFDPACLGIDGVQGRDPIDLSRPQYSLLLIFVSMLCSGCAMRFSLLRFSFGGAGLNRSWGGIRGGQSHIIQSILIKPPNTR